VWLASIYVWGFTGGEATEALAIDRGIAFQLTNILRDLREDAALGRTYLPSDELAAAGVSQDDLKQTRGSAAFTEMMRTQIARADSYYVKSAALEGFITADSRSTLIAMTAIYRGLLHKIADEPQRVLRERVSLSLLHKLRIGWRATRAK
jgi:phytoene synthase